MQDALKPNKSEGDLREWRITLVHATGQFLGEFEAPDGATAIKMAIAKFNVPSAQRLKGLIAAPIE